MLISFSVENFKSFSDPQTFTTTPGKYQKKKDHVFKTKQANVLKLSCIYGANASGKSNFFEAIARAKIMIEKGSVPLNYSNLTFRLDNEKKEDPSNFEFVMLTNNKIYAYGFSVDFNKSTILKEYLYQITGKQEKLLFDFDHAMSKYHIDDKTLKDKDNSNRIELYRREVEDDSKYFFLHKIAGRNLKFKDDEFINSLKNVYNWFTDVLTIIGPDSTYIDIVGLFDDRNNTNEISVIELIRTFDTGITDFKKEQIEYKTLFQKLRSETKEEHRDEFEDFVNDVETLEPNTSLSFIYNNDCYKIWKEEGQIVAEKLLFIHCGVDCVSFGYKEESDGTKRLIELINILNLAQFREKVFIVDELDRSLHPNLSYNFIEKFITLSAGKAAQLIVTTHESALMDLSLLRQDEIWVVDRNSNGTSNMVSLSNFSIRSDKVIDKDYLFGRYGGVPQLSKIIKKRGV